MYYYLLKKNETNLLVFTTIMIIVAFIIISKEMFIFILFASLFLLFIFGLIIPKIKVIKDTIIFIIISFIIISFTLSWIFEIQLSYVGIISNNEMLVLGTFLFAFLTYNAMRKNTELFQDKRMPYFKVKIEENILNKHVDFIITNISDFPAKNIWIDIEIIYPIPKTFISSLKLFLMGELISIFAIFKNHNYTISYVSESLESKDNMKINIYDEILKLSHINSSQLEKHFNRSYSNEDIFFNIIIKCKYTSKDNLPLKNPIYNIFEFKSGIDGVKLIHKSGDPKLLKR